MRDVRIVEKGFGVAAESAVRQALHRPTQHIDGAMIDVNMPGMNGIDTCRALKANAFARGRDLPVWMMTGARTPDVVKRAEEAGALILLGKPFDFADLFRRFDEQFRNAPPPPGAPQPGVPQNESRIG